MCIRDSNRSHSVGYALIAYQTAWLKAHYPAEFMASVLSCDLGNTDNIQLFVDDCKNIGLTVLSPDINKSSYRFEDLDSSTILYGLGAIKGIGESLVEQIVTERQSKRFEDMYDFCMRVGFNRVNKRILTTLIGSGAMDSLGSREDLFRRIDSCLKNAEQASERHKSNIKDLFGEEIVTPSQEEIDENIEFDEVSAEWNALGFYLDSHPLENKKREVRKMCGFFISELQSETHKQRIAGCLMQFNVRQGKRGRFAFATLDDGSANIEVSIWADVFEKYRNLLKKGQVLVIEGIIEKDDYSDSVKHKMIAERILTFDEARREYIKNIKINIENNTEETNSVVNSLKEIANSSEGNTVLISYKGNSAKADIALPSNFSVKLDDSSVKALDKRFGAENVEFVYHTQTHIN